MGEKLRSNVYEATCPRFSSIVVVKFARTHWEIQYLEKETAAYEWIKDHPIGPEFLGHVAEEGRIMGFIMSRVEDGHHATLDETTMMPATRLCQSYTVWGSSTETLTSTISSCMVERRRSSILTLHRRTLAEMSWTMSCAVCRIT